MKKLFQKASVLIEALPYIKNFYGKIFVIKYGGNAMIDVDLKKKVLHDILLLKFIGINPVIVHGGGPFISDEMKKHKIIPQFVDGLRVTDKKIMAIVKKVFKKINKNIVKISNDGGGKAISLMGDDNQLIMSKQRDKKLGLVGDIVKINPEIVKTLIKNNYIPVVSPIGVDDSGGSYNINADTAAAALAVALKAEKLTLLTNVEGVIERRLIPTLTIEQIKKKIKMGVIHSGMIPKVLACVHAVEGGCKKAHLINGTIEHSLLLEIFANQSIGTEIVKE